MLIDKEELGKIVEGNHPLRLIHNIISFSILKEEIEDCYSKLGRKGYGAEIGLKCMFLQFYYDLSDRQLEERMRYDIAFRWFCNFNLSDQTPDHSYFCRTRKIIGTKRVGKILLRINNKCKEAGIIRGVFHFVDSQAIKAKETTWKQRDKALQSGEESLNNNNVAKYSADKDARFGCKGKDQFWYGYKRHCSCDMGSGLIQKVAVTKANATDQDSLKHICPYQGMVIGDKSYCLSTAQKIMKMRNCHSGAILKNNMKEKNTDKDRWLSKLRAPFEGLFSSQAKRARYRRLVKVQFQAFLEAIVFNIKRLVILNVQPLFQI